MRDVDAVRDQEMSGDRSVEEDTEGPGRESGRIQRAARGEPRPFAAQGELAADGAERTGEMPGAQVEIPDHGLTPPVPMTGQVEHLAIELALERSEDAGADRQLVEIARGARHEPPPGLTARLPEDLAIRRQPQRIAGVKTAGDREMHLAHLQLRPIETDVPVAQHRRAGDSRACDAGTVGHYDDGTADAGMPDADGHPGGQELRRMARPGWRCRPPDLDVDTLDRRVRRDDGLPEK